MEKTIEVEKCGECPFSDGWDNDMGYVTICTKQNKYRVASATVDEDCPLKTSSVEIKLKGDL